MVTVTEFDFEARTLGEIAPERVQDAVAAGRCVWIDVQVADTDAARAILRGLGLLDDELVEGILGEGPPIQYARYEDLMHLVLSGTRSNGAGFDLQRLSVVVAERYVVTTHRGRVEFLEAVRRDYRTDFLRFAKSLSFLVYEMLDHLLESYLATQNALGDRVEVLQAELGTAAVDDGVFQRISTLGADLLHFRKLLLPVRALLSDLSTRRTLCLSEATQRFLGNMVGTVDHLIQDMMVDREILSEPLNLYMSVTSHRTNQVMKRLTGVSFLFLPLTFLVGVYGMNFRWLPELEWEYGYVFFWITAGALAAGILAFMRRTRLL